MMSGQNDVLLRVPRDPSSLALVRAVLGSVVVQADLTYSQIDDLRIAVAEAAGTMVSIPGAATWLTVEIDVQPRDVHVRLVADPPLDASVTFAPGSVPALIVTGLADEVTSGEDDRGSWIIITKRGTPA